MFAHVLGRRSQAVCLFLFCCFSHHFYYVRCIEPVACPCSQIIGILRAEELLCCIFREEFCLACSCMLAAKSLRWPTWHWELQHRFCLPLTYVVRFVCVFWWTFKCSSGNLYVFLCEYVHMSTCMPVPSNGHTLPLPAGIDAQAHTLTYTRFSPLLFSCRVLMRYGDFS